MVGMILTAFMIVALMEAEVPVAAMASLMFVEVAATTSVGRVAARVA